MDTLFYSLAIHFDLPFLNWIRQHLTCPLLDKLMPVITSLGNAGLLWIGVTLVLLLIRRYRSDGIAMAIALLTGLVICNLCMKPLFARIRPFDLMQQHFGTAVALLIDAPTDFSFPSGHTIASFEAAAVLLRRKPGWGICALILAVLIAFSRLYLYVHYPTDVLCSVVLGCIIGCCACKAADTLQKTKLIRRFL